MKHSSRVRRPLLLIAVSAAPLASAQTFVWENPTPHHVRSVDLATDFDGDGLPDALTGDPITGIVRVLSGLDGHELQSL